MESIFIFCASLFAGFMDAVVGGGGLILVPALFATYPAMSPATLLGSNKGASVWGTAFAVARYSRRVNLSKAVMLPAMAWSFLCALLGAWCVTVISPHFLRQLLPVALVVVLIYTWRKKDMGITHAPRLDSRKERLAACVIGGLLGFYDGLFGPGAGSFLVFLLVRWLGYDFLHASAGAKFLNLASNLAALMLFTMKGHVWWKLALGMAVANVMGSLIGTHLALKHGAGFVRGVFLFVVSALILRTAWMAIHG